MNNTLSIVQIMKSPRKIKEGGEVKEDKIEMVSFKVGCGFPNNQVQGISGQIVKSNSCHTLVIFFINFDVCS